MAGTLVATERSLAPIEEIEAGDLVWSRDELTGETALKPVSALIRRHEREICELTLSIDGCTLAFFETTDDHPWRTLDGACLPTAALSAGMRIERAEGAPATVLSVVLTDRTESTYNLEVAADYSELEPYVRAKAAPGDASYFWRYEDCCTDMNVVRSGRVPDKDGRIPTRGAY